MLRGENVLGDVKCWENRRQLRTTFSFYHRQTFSVIPLLVKQTIVFDLNYK